MLQTKNKKKTNRRHSPERIRKVQEYPNAAWITTKKRKKNFIFKTGNLN